MNLTKQFFKYVSQNIFGLLGTSCYILADTYFIAQAAGTDGVTLLNLCLPIYNLIFAFGSMIGLGAATRYAILRAQGDARAQRYFSNAIFSVCILAVPFMLVGIFRPDGLLRLMGGDADIVALGMNYARIFLMFTPFFMCNYVVASFVRNDGDPSLAMVATLSGSLFNVVFDYIFIFPMGLGLPGAAPGNGHFADIEHCRMQCTFYKEEQHHHLCAQGTVRQAAGPELPAGHLRLCWGAFLRRDDHRFQLPAAAPGGQCGGGGLWRGGELCAGGNGHLQRRGAGRSAAGEPVLRQK